MAFLTSEFIELRPFAYHVTDRASLPRLQRDGCIRPTAELLAATGREDLLRTRRRNPVRLSVAGEVVVLKDQTPLLEANTLLTGGWSFGDFVECLNRRVFFWPGTPHGPIGPGKNLLKHYESEGPAVLRVPTRQLLEVNAGVEPLYCAFNSGSPRCQHGERVPRGPDLFTTADRFSRRASQVVELVFAAAVLLPPSSLIRDGDTWQRLFMA